MFHIPAAVLSGLACLPIIVLSSLIPSPFCSLSPLYLFFLGTFGILSLQVMTIDVASHIPPVVFLPLPFTWLLVSCCFFPQLLRDRKFAEK